MRRIIFLGMEQYICVRCISSSEADVVLVTTSDSKVIGQISTYPLYSRDKEMLEKAVDELLPDNQEFPIIIDGASYRRFFKEKN